MRAVGFATLMLDVVSFQENGKNRERERKKEKKEEDNLQRTYVLFSPLRIYNEYSVTLLSDL